MPWALLADSQKSCIPKAKLYIYIYANSRGDARPPLCTWGTGRYNCKHSRATKVNGGFKHTLSISWRFRCRQFIATNEANKQTLEDLALSHSTVGGGLS